MALFFLAIPALVILCCVFCFSLLLWDNSVISLLLCFYEVSQPRLLLMYSPSIFSAFLLSHHSVSSLNLHPLPLSLLTLIGSLSTVNDDHHIHDAGNNYKPISFTAEAYLHLQPENFRLQFRW